MPTLNKDAKQALYAVAGVADLAVSTIRQLPQEAERFRARFPGEAAKTRVRRSAKTTRTSAKAASTTVRRAAEADAKAARDAAAKVGDK